MSSYINHYVSTCFLCQTKKAPRGTEPGQLITSEVSLPFEQVGIDVIGPLPTAHGKNYIIVAIDYFTKYIETQALPSQNAKNTAKFVIEKIFVRHGAPKMLLSDQGTNFTSKLLAEVTEILLIKHNFSTPYHPQTNGQVERVNSVIKGMLLMYVNEYHSDWDEILPLVTFAYNVNIQASTKMSPFEMIFGRKPLVPDEYNVPIDIPVFDK